MHLSWGLERRRERQGGEEAPARDPRRPRRDRQPTASDEAVVHKACRNPQRPRRRRQERHRAAAEEAEAVGHAYARAASRCPPGLAYSATRERPAGRSLEFNEPGLPQRRGLVGGADPGQGRIRERLRAPAASGKRGESRRSVKSAAAAGVRSRGDRPERVGSG